MERKIPEHDNKFPVFANPENYIRLVTTVKMLT